jgi:hypothetical protein
MIATLIDRVWRKHPFTITEDPRWSSPFGTPIRDLQAALRLAKEWGGQSVRLQVPIAVAETMAGSQEVRDRWSIRCQPDDVEPREPLTLDQLCEQLLAEFGDAREGIPVAVVIGGPGEAVTVTVEWDGWREREFRMKV